jgi:hypothetical protein
VTIEQLDRVDLILTRPHSPEVRLVITDHLDWSDPHTHCLQLQSKINAYLDFVMSGELRTYLGTKCPPDAIIRIDVIGMNAPAPEGEEFFRRAAEVLRDEGIGFGFEHRPMEDEAGNSVHPAT